MGVKTCAEYAPTLCATCCCRDLCTDRLRRRNKKLANCACLFNKRLWEVQHFLMGYNSKEFTDWGSKYNEFYRSVIMQTKEEFNKMVDSYVKDENFAFADRLKACYAVYSDAVLIYVDRAFALGEGC